MASPKKTPRKKSRRKKTILNPESLLSNQLEEVFYYFSPPKEILEESKRKMNELIPFLYELNLSCEEMEDHNIKQDYDKLALALLLIANLSTKINSFKDNRNRALSMLSEIENPTIHETNHADLYQISIDFVEYGKLHLFRFEYDLKKLLEKYSIGMS